MSRFRLEDNAVMVGETMMGVIERLEDGDWYFWPAQETWPGCWDGQLMRWIADRLGELNKMRCALCGKVFVFTSKTFEQESAKVIPEKARICKRCAGKKT